MGDVEIVATAEGLEVVEGQGEQGFSRLRLGEILWHSVDKQSFGGFDDGRTVELWVSEHGTRIPSM